MFTIDSFFYKNFVEFVAIDVFVFKRILHCQSNIIINVCGPRLLIIVGRSVIKIYILSLFAIFIDLPIPNFGRRGRWISTLTRLATNGGRFSSNILHRPCTKPLILLYRYKNTGTWSAQIKKHDLFTRSNILCQI